MCCGMVCTGLCTKLRIHNKLYFLANMNHAGYHMSDMSVFAAEKLDGIFHCKLTVRGADDTLISLLATHGRIERSLVHDDRSVISVRKCINDLTLGCHDGYAGLVCQVIVSNEFGCDRRINLLVNSSIRTHVVCHLTGVSRLLSLFLHACLKLILVVGKSLLLKDFFG